MVLMVVVQVRECFCDKRVERRVGRKLFSKEFKLSVINRNVSCTPRHIFTAVADTLQRVVRHHSYESNRKERKKK